MTTAPETARAVTEERIDVAVEDMIAQFFESEVEKLRAMNPNLTVAIGCYCSHHHAGMKRINWSVDCGHDEANGPTLKAALHNLSVLWSPETKLARAADLRREADRIEAEAKGIA